MDISTSKYGKKAAQERAIKFKTIAAISGIVIVGYILLQIAFFTEREQIDTKRITPRNDHSTQQLSQQRTRPLEQYQWTKLVKTAEPSLLTMVLPASRRYVCEVEDEKLSVEDVRKLLIESVGLGTQFILNNQLPEGNFVYEFNWRTGKLTKGDSSVRQAGAAWALALIYLYQPSPDVRASLDRTLLFFESNSHIVQQISPGLTENNNNPVFAATIGRLVTYPGDRQGSLGTICLLMQAHIDYLRALEQEMKQRTDPSTYLDRRIDELYARLAEYTAFVLSAFRGSSGVLASSYAYDGGVHEDDFEWSRQVKFSPNNSPYFDGEGLLALIKIAKYLNVPKLWTFMRLPSQIQYTPESLERALWETLVNAGRQMADMHIIQALQTYPDSDKTKGFYQWSSMAFSELATINHPALQPHQQMWFAQLTIELADWMIDIHHTLKRKMNTGYAYEGIGSAQWLASLIAADDSLPQNIRDYYQERSNRLVCVSQAGLLKLTSWQIGHSIANNIIKEAWDTPTIAEGENEPAFIHHDPELKLRTEGGVQNNHKLAELRIDVCQHQMHALIISLKHTFVI